MSQPNHVPPVRCDRCGSAVGPDLVKDGECRPCRERSDGFDPREAMLEHAEPK